MLVSVFKGLLVVCLLVPSGGLSLSVSVCWCLLVPASGLKASVSVSECIWGGYD